MRLALAAALLLLARPAHAAEWVRVETSNFIVMGDTSERRLKEVAAEFERFREALGRVIPSASRTAAVPTMVLVFGSHRAFEPYRPRYNGRLVRANGTFYSTEDMNIVSIVDTDREEATRTIFHEYVHLVVGNDAGAVPVWLNEGIAEYYSTFSMTNAGRRAVIGTPILSHLQLFTKYRALPLAELLSVVESSPLYNEGERRSLFYAQSWALVHMILGTMPNGSAQLGKYATLTGSGVAPMSAWRQVFGSEDVIPRLERYLGSQMQGLMYTFDRDIGTVRLEASKALDADVQAALGDLLLRVAPDEALAFLKKTLSAQPGYTRVRAILGLAELNNGRRADARTLLIEAARDTSAWLTQYNVATGLTRLISETNEADADADRLAREALGIVFRARPELPHAHALSAWLHYNAGAELNSSLQSVRKARQLAPGRPDYALLEASILMRRGEYTAARELVTPLTAAGHLPQIRESAQRRLTEIARFEQAATDNLARLEGRPIQRSDPQAPGTPRDEPTLSVPVYRKVGPGEERTEGLLERIECSATRAILHVRVRDAIQQFSAPELESIIFISHRADLPRTVYCAPRNPPDRAYIFSRAPEAGETHRRVVAVEFLAK